MPTLNSFSSQRTQITDLLNSGFEGSTTQIAAKLSLRENSVAVLMRDLVNDKIAQPVRWAHPDNSPNRWTRVWGSYKDGQCAPRPNASNKGYSQKVLPKLGIVLWGLPI